jgi:hypothetical protein
MFIYFFIFCLLISASIFESFRNIDKKYYIFFIFILILFVGLRFETGGDSSSYLMITSNFLLNPTIKLELALFIRSFSLFYFDTLALSDFIFSLIAFFSIYKFCSNSNYKFTLLVFYFPFFIVHCIMGYVDQAIAISLISFAFTFKIYSRNFYLYLLLATLFHFSAILFFVYFLFTFLVIQNNNYRFKYVFLFIFLLLMTLITYKLFLNYSNYLSNFVTSKGGFIRELFFILIVTVPIIRFYKNKNFYNKKFQLINLLLFIYIPYVLLTPFFYSNVFYDRINFYFIPLVVMMINFYLNDIQINKKQVIMYNLYINFLVFIYFLSWFSFSNNAKDWIPYKTIFYFL